MSILNFNGKQATAGLPCLYHLVSGMILFSEAVQEDGDSYIFDGEKTLLLATEPGSKPREMSVSMQKLSEIGFKAKVSRIPKSVVSMIQDCGEPSLIAKAHEALSGLILAKTALPPMN
jgi:hypothetical protein